MLLGHTGENADGPAPFVGRDGELAALSEALTGRRLITLTGPGGVGKTRLARQAATAAAGPAGPFPDGTHWADLSPLPGERLLVNTVADALDLADHTARTLAEAVHAWIGGRRLLLVLDCCEHLTAAVRTLVRDLLDHAPHLVLLLTSREPLGLAGEHVLELGPLPYEADAGEALALFAARARTVRPGQAPPWNPERLAAARAICARLEGVPLALELAAAQLTDHTVEELADRLARRIGPLSGRRDTRPPRHRALRTAIGWSHEWCTPRERLLWLRLSVFGGAFDEDTARAVCSAPPLTEEEVPPLLAALVAKSVVRRVPGRTRYRMLDTIREYGAMWQAEAGEREVLRDRHAAHFLGLARAAERDWLGPRQRAAYRRVAAGHGDLCAALDHYLATAPATALELVGRVGFFWACCGYLHVARGYLERALAATRPEDADPAARVRALWALGVALLLQGEQEEAHRLAVGCEALAVGRADAEPQAALDAAYLLGLSHLLAGRPLAARIVADNVLEAVPGTPFDSASRLRCHLVRVFALTGTGLFADARAEAQSLREGCVIRQEQWMRSYADYQLALISLFEGRPAESAAHAEAMLEGKREIGDIFGTALGLDLLAAARAANGDEAAAAHAYGTGYAYWQAVGHPQRGTPELGPVRQEFERTARSVLGDRAYEAAFAEGVRHGRAQRARAQLAWS
ncbi:NB-ARC domain-containing protein [Streptomyces sp. NBC_00249]|uniref:ATP-binding protein n=1 Tax=Streptomyces sp. NBC_00249 TaxID=2975690 RepID=UPI0022554320|nr:AAA family ATPase [Streptomyces sp. NBC_00249]MCX5192681.1 NB-ARC domain-containing protein [Streptomyces sp. NBC_00249]